MEIGLAKKVIRIKSAVKSNKIIKKFHLSFPLNSMNYFIYIRNPGWQGLAKIPIVIFFNSGFNL